MEEVYLVISTDLWGTITSFKTIGVTSSVEQGIILARQDEDLIADVKEEYRHVIMVYYTVDKYNSQKLVFTTSIDKDFNLLIRKEN